MDFFGEMNFNTPRRVIYILIRVNIMKLFGKIMTLGWALTAGCVAAGCDSLWDAEMDVSPDYYGFGVSVPAYGYYPGPPVVDPSLWNPGTGGWGWGVNVPPPAPPQQGVRPGVRPGLPNVRPNGPVGYQRPGYNTPSTSAPEVTPPANTPPPQSPSQGSGYHRPGYSQGRH